MFGLGPTELMVILVLVLVLLGPKKLPEVASGLGKAIRQFRKATSDLTNQLDIDEEVKQPFRELKAAIRDEPAPYVAPVIVPPPAAAPPPNTVAKASVPIAPNEPTPQLGTPVAPPAAHAVGAEPAAPSITPDAPKVKVS